MNTRSLGLFRIALGVTLLFILVERISCLQPLFSGEGIIPLSVWEQIREQNIKKGYYFLFPSIHALNDSLPFQQILIGIELLFTLCFLFGFKTRMANIVVFYLTLSWQFRFSMLLNGGDAITRWLLFWSIFLPLNHHYSVDLKLGLNKESNQKHSSPFTVAFVLQIFIMYIFAGINKHGSTWSDGTAIIKALQFDLMKKDLGGLLISYPTVLSSLTHLVRYVEIAVPLLLFIPKQLGRTIFVVIFSIFYISLFFVMYTGGLILAGLTTLIPFLPDRIWLKHSTNIPVEHRGHVLRKIVAGLMITLALVDNFKHLPHSVFKSSFFVDPSRFLVSIAMPQVWSFYAPNPPKDTGWFQIIGHADNKKKFELDIHKSEWRHPFTLIKPRNVFATQLVNRRWQKLFWRLRFKKKGNLLKAGLAKFVCNNPQNQKMKSVQIYYFKQKFKTSGILGPAKRQTVIKRKC